MTIACRSYAKINLYLDVLNQRRDGFNNIETVFLTVGLFDTLTFEAGAGGVELACSHPELPCDASNLVLRAAQALRNMTGCAQGARIRLEKEIPIAAGLAGGSGNAAATLQALNRLWGLDLPRRALYRLALDLGSDVPYCLEGGAMAATGRGERLTPLPPVPEAPWFVLIHPPIQVTARMAYTSPILERSPEQPFAGRTASFRRALRAFRGGRWADAVSNRMETAVFPVFPELAMIKRRLLDAGCPAAAMSGSGPTVFGVCATRAGADRAAALFPEYRASVVPPVCHGVCWED
jgi:4-diphosphocytidyl-2-C-methyl-D-erythritol kinase